MKRVLVTGSRNWKGRDAVFAALQEHLGGELHGVVVHGDCPTGADHMAQQWVDLQPGLVAERHPADWGAHGKAAGPIRNQQMVDLGADVVLAFPHLDSRGTTHCITAARRAGLSVVIYTEETE